MDNLDEIIKYRSRHKSDGIILDSNLLLLFLIGNYNSQLIDNYNPISKSRQDYSVDDFERLKQILKLFLNKIIITPQIIAEVSNLTITGNRSAYGEQLLGYIKAVISLMQEMTEHHQSSNCLWGMEIKIISEFGFTDLTILELAKEKRLPILTDDFPFFSLAISKKIPTFRFSDYKNSKYKLVN